MEHKPHVHKTLAEERQPVVRRQLVPFLDHGKNLEDHSSMGRPQREAPRMPTCLFPVVVVYRPLVRVDEHLMCAANMLELVADILADVSIRMVFLHRK